MRKIFEILMDITLVLLFILVSSNYIETLPRYSPKTELAKSVIAKSNLNTDQHGADVKVNSASVVSFK